MGQAVDSLLENGRVATAALVLAELAQGARSEKEISQLRKYLQPLYWIEGLDRHWEEAGELSFRMRQKGKTVNLTDCYLARLAAGSEATIFSLDKHFRWIADLENCPLFAI